MNNIVSLEYVEGKIYAKLDAMLMRGETHYDEKFSLNEGCRLNISISSKNSSPIFPNNQFNSSEIDISLNFGSGIGNFFRADNQANHDFLHLHFESGLQPIDERIPFPENGTVYQIVSDIFEKAKEIIPLHLPNFFSLNNGSEFVETA